MKKTAASVSGPQHSLSYRMVAFWARLQVRYLLTLTRHQHLVSMLFVLASGATAIGIITFMAWLTDLPLLFPPLGPSAFILFYTPLAESACPRNVTLAHGLAVCCGLAAFHGSAAIFGVAETAATFSWHSVAAMVAAMASVSLAMVALHCVHPPAAATSLIAAMGYVENSIQGIGIMAAVLLLVAAAIVFNRYIGGLPYPYWSFDPQVLRSYSHLAGLPHTSRSRWQQMVQAIFQRH